MSGYNKTISEHQLIDAAFAFFEARLLILQNAGDMIPRIVADVPSICQVKEVYALCLAAQAPVRIRRP